MVSKVAGIVMIQYTQNILDMVQRGGSVSLPGSKSKKLIPKRACRIVNEQKAVAGKVKGYLTETNVPGRKTRPRILSVFVVSPMRTLARLSHCAITLNAFVIVSLDVQVLRNKACQWRDSTD